MRYLTLQSHLIASTRPEIPGSLRGSAPKPGPGAGPWPQRSVQTAQAAEGGREFQREGGNASQCMVPSLSLRIRRPLQRPRLAMQEPGLSIQDFLAPVVIKGDQETSSSLLKPSL